MRDNVKRATKYGLALNKLNKLSCKQASCGGKSINGLILYLPILGLMVKVQFTLFCTVAALFCLHTGGIH
jgi:hypothetical protein